MAERKTALVTGANKGIGLEIVRQLAGKGWDVFLTARKPAAGEKAVALLQTEEKLKGTVRFLELDVTDSASVQRAAKAVAGLVGKLDALINNAGILEDGNGNVLETEPKLLLTTIDTNVGGPLRVIQAFWPLLEKSNPGRIINMSSGGGRLSDMEDWAPAYSISKAALNALTRQAAAALRDKGILVNAMSPGWVRTDMGGAEAPGTVEQGADTAVWLATEGPKNVTGEYFADRKSVPW